MVSRTASLSEQSLHVASYYNR